MYFRHSRQISSQHIYPLLFFPVPGLPFHSQQESMMIRFTSVAASLVVFAGMSAHSETTPSAQMTVSETGSRATIAEPADHFTGRAYIAPSSHLSPRKEQAPRMSPSCPAHVLTGIPIRLGKHWWSRPGRAGCRSGGRSEKPCTPGMSFNARQGLNTGTAQRIKPRWCIWPFRNRMSRGKT